jgi:hypothetical protein
MRVEAKFVALRVWGLIIDFIRFIGSTPALIGLSGHYLNI